MHAKTILSRYFTGLFVFQLLIQISLNQGVFSQNPIVPPGVYIADPSAKVWSDGRIYVYGSRDESPFYYCSWRHDVLWSEDLRSWQIAENVFASKGSGDEIPYSDALLYAPDCAYKDGVYYLYYCLASFENTEGVATSLSPLGPFRKGRVMNASVLREIDPAVFIDDDGQAYYVWGQFSAKMAKLKPGMDEIDETTIRDGIVTEKEHFFHEGGYLIKRNGIYYFIYAHMGRANRPTCLGYAMASNVWGPYHYGGVIIDNDHCDPAVWNNHGSIVQFNGKWYVFYHRSTHASNTMRKACVEPITFNDDGTINEVEMTSQGAGPPLPAKRLIDAERACLLFGNTRIVMESPSNEVLAGIRNDDKAAYKYIDFGKGVDSVLFRVRSVGSGGIIDVAVDQPWGRSVAQAEVPAYTGGWTVVAAPVRATEGVHAVWLRFYGKGENLFEVDWLQFTPHRE